MHLLLKKLLEKRGVSNVTELKAGEGKEDFDRWNKILSTEGDITVEKIKDFCQNQVKTIEGKWRDLDNSEKKNERLVLLHTVYSAIIEAMEVPQKQRESLEQYLRQLIDE